MMKTICKMLVGLALALFVLPAWAGSIGLQMGSGKLSFKGSKGPFSARGTIVDLSFGKELFPAIGSFSFITGNFSSFKPNEWLFGAGGHLSFSGCLDVDLDHDKKCDKKDFKGSLLTGTFKSAEIFKTGKNTFTFDGQVWLIVAPALAKEFGITGGVPFLANITLNFTDCIIYSDTGPLCGCRGKITGGTLSAPEPTALVLLGLGVVLAGFGHKTLLSHSCLHT